MNVYITFSGDFYHATTAAIVERAPELGADRVMVYDDHWLVTHRPEFRRLNSWFWDHKATGVNIGRPDTRGFGWFIWKPYIMLDALSRLEDEDDVVLFTDADTFPISRLSRVFEIARADGVMLFAAENCDHRRWCKRDCFVVMGQDRSPYTDPGTQHAVARFYAFRRGDRQARQFLAEWLTYCCNPLANTFDVSVLAPEYPGFQEHRCEQAILTNLAHRYGYKLWREACEAGEVTNRDRDQYPQLFSHVNVAGSPSYGPTRGNGSYFRNVFN